MSDTADGTDKPSTIVLLVAVAAAVFGGHVLLIAALGSPMPFWDQWDAEAASLYAPYLQGTLRVSDLFGAHNEHRIVFTRLLALVHLELAGEWNPRLEMVLGALVHAGVVTWLTALLMPLVAQARRLLFAVFVAFMFALPIGYENTIWGFQSHFYFLALFSLGALACLSAGAALSPRWFAGVVFAICSYISLSSGAATMLVAAVLVALQLVVGARERRVREVAALAAMIAIGVVMVLGVRRSSSQVPFEAWSFIQGFITLAALPLATIAGLLFVQGPGMWLSLHTLATRPPRGSRLWIAVALLGWIAAQLALFAYGRGTVMGLRYLDIAILAYPIGFVAVLLLADRLRAGRGARFATPVAVTWVFVMVALLAVLSYYSSLRGALEWDESRKVEMANLTAYLAGQDPAEGEPLPYPRLERLAEILAIPEIRAILPPEIRPPDADVGEVRQRMLLKGAIAGPVADTVRVVLLISPGFIALAIALFFAVGTRAVVRVRRGQPVS